MRAIAILAYLAAASIAASASMPATGGPASREAIDRFYAHVSPPLSSYRAVRHLTASVRGGRMQASLTARTWLDATQGFGYEVVDAGGSSMIQKRVLIAALEAERQMHVNGTGPRGALTPDNYDFTPSVQIDPAESDPSLVRIDVRARRRDTMLIDGAMFLSPDGGDLVRVEGVLVRRPSFWTRRVSVVRRYARVAGVRAPVAMESTAQVLIVGAASFAMTYDYEMVNGALVHP